MYKSARNIDRVTVSPVAGLNALVLLQPQAGADDQGRARSRCGRLRQEGEVAASKSTNRVVLIRTGRNEHGHRHHHHEANCCAPHQVILRPLVTEKGMHRSTRYNAYAFESQPQATKDDVAGGRGIVQREGARGAHAEPQGQAAPDAFQSTATPRTGRRRSSSCIPRIASTSFSRSSQE